MAKKKSAKASIDSLKHKDKRANIPTAELQNFIQEDEIKPKKILYPRDPHLDPPACLEGKGRAGPERLGSACCSCLYSGEDSSAGFD